MSDNLVKLLTQRFDIERRIHQLKNSNLTESQSAGADAMLAKLEAALAKVNEEYAIQQNMPMAEKENHPAPTDQPDHEVNMARSDLYRAGKSAMALEKMLQQVSEQQGIEGWVQAKITKAADYLESVYHYFDYEMNGNGEVDEAAAYGPGQSSTNPEAEENAMNQKPMALGGQQQQPQAPGAPQQSQQLKPGQVSATPPVGGAGPMATADGMVKMAKLGPDKKPMGDPIIVKPMEISAKQKLGFTVIGESTDKPKAKVVHCSQCGKGFSGGGLTAPHQTGFSHCKDHKGMKIVAEATDPRDSRPETWRPNNTGYAWDRLSTRMTSDPKDSKARKAGKQSGLKSSIKDALGKHGPKGKLPEDASAGASSAGGMGASPTGFASGGIGMQKRKKMGEGMMVSRADADTALANPNAKAIWGRYGQYNAQDLIQEFPNLSPNDAAMIANWAEGGWANGPTQSEMRGKVVHSILQLKQKGIGESGDAGYGPKDRGVADGYYGRPPNPHKVVTDETGKRMRVKLTDPAEIAEYMAGYKDDSFGSKNYGESADKKVYKEKPVDTKKAEKIKAYRADRDKHMEEETGPKFTGYYKGTDKGKPGKKMVGGM